MPYSRPRLITALVCYAGLALLAAVTLEGLFRIAVWVLLGGLALKTWIAAVAQKREDAE